MRIFDQYDHLLETADKSRGYLKRDSRFLCHHPAVEAVAGKGHYKTVKEYPNGGKDVAWVVDVPSVEARQAWDEYEDILRYTPYTQEDSSCCSLHCRPTGPETDRRAEGKPAKYGLPDFKGGGGRCDPC